MEWATPTGSWRRAGAHRPRRRAVRENVRLMAAMPRRRTSRRSRLPTFPGGWIQLYAAHPKLSRRTPDALMWSPTAQLTEGAAPAPALTLNAWVGSMSARGAAVRQAADVARTILIGSPVELHRRPRVTSLHETPRPSERKELLHNILDVIATPQCSRCAKLLGYPARSQPRFDPSVLLCTISGPCPMRLLATST
jgi:hypothetical protein